MPTERIPLVGSVIVRGSDPGFTLSDEQIFTNCYPEIVSNPVTGKGKVYLYKRLGFDLGSELESGATPTYGACHWQGSSSSPAVFSFIKDGALSTVVYNSLGTKIGGDIEAKDCLALTDTLISGTGYLTGIFKSSSNALVGWFYPEGGAWTNVTSNNFPTDLVPEHAHMDGYWFVMTRAGLIHQSDVNSVSTWPATGSIAAQSMPDKGVGLARYRDFIVGFGEGTTEFFYNAGNATGSVLSPVDNATLRIGALYGTIAGVRTILTVGGTVYWIGIDSGSGKMGVYRLNGMQAQKVSNAAIDKMLSNTTISNFRGAFSMHGMTHIVMNGWAYCVDSNFWWELPGLNGSSGIDAIVGLSDSSVSVYATAGTDPRLYSHAAGAPKFRDATTTAINMTVLTQNIDFGTDNEKFWERLRLIGDRVSTSSVFGISYSDDDYQNFSTPRLVNLSTTYNELTRLGASKRRAWKITHSSNAAVRLEALDLIYRVGPR